MRCFLFVTFAIHHSCYGTDAAGHPSPDTVLIERLIVDLASRDYEVRDSATRTLRRIGPRALHLLADAAQSRNLERRYRARIIEQHINGAGGRIVRAYSADVRSIDLEAGKRLEVLRRDAARALEPLETRYAMDMRLDQACAIQRQRRGLLWLPTADEVTLPPSARRVTRDFDEAYEALVAQLDDSVKQRRHALLLELEELRTGFAGDGDKPKARLVADAIRTLTEGGEAKKALGSVNVMKSQPGESHLLEVTGALTGSVWGTDIYTTDSAIAAVAVHSGVLDKGQTAVVKVTVLPGKASYRGSTRNGVTTRAWGGYPSSFKIERVFRVRDAGEHPVEDLPRAARLLNAYRTDFAALKGDADRRIRDLRRHAAEILEPIQDELTLAERLDEAVAVRSRRRIWLEVPDPVGAPPAPEEARRVLAQLETDTTEAEEAAAARIEQRRSITLSRLKTLEGDFSSAGQTEGAKAIREMISALESGYVMAQPDPGTVNELKSDVGTTYFLNVTGSATGSVWGTDVYTTDSTIAAVAVHAGVLEVGQTGVVNITVRPGLKTYEGSTRNGVTTSGWGAYRSSFTIERSFGARDHKARKPSS